MKQRTISNPHIFEGKGLHTGRPARMVLKPAAPDTGILFVRTDIGPGAAVRALAENISDTSRSTTVSEGGVRVITIEHLMSALTGFGVDNAIVEVDSEELPILDGSARPYAEALGANPTVEQDALRHYVSPTGVIEVSDPSSGSWIRIEPCDTYEYEATIDFNSRILGVSTVKWDSGIDYASQIAPCRTFVFLHELEYLYSKGLVRGGDVDNAIVIVEHPVSEERLDALCRLFGKEKLNVTEGYLDNLRLHFDDECARHKLLDLIGDLRLAGGLLNARVTACKPGHTLNAKAAKALREATKR